LLNPLQHPCAHLAQAAASPPYRHRVPDPAVHGFTLPKCTAFFPSRCPYLLVTEAKWQFPSFPFPHHSSPLFCSHSHCSAVPCQATMSPSELLSRHPCVSSDSRAASLTNGLSLHIHFCSKSIALTNGSSQDGEREHSFKSTTRQSLSN
jgi:hypothetical protein